MFLASVFENPIFRGLVVEVEAECWLTDMLFIEIAI
jgi:hypothetical protein